MSTISERPIGTRERVVATYRDSTLAGTPLADPTVATIVVRAPGGTLTTYTSTAGDVVRDSTGVWHLDTDLDAAGDWLWRGVGSGAIVCASPDHKVRCIGSALA